MNTQYTLTRFFLQTIILLTALCPFFFNIAAHAADDTASRPARAVKVMQIKRVSENKVLSFPGISNASREVKLSFRVSGPVQALPVKIGQHVHQGEMIARIDPRDYQLAISRLEAAMDEAGANLSAMRHGARKQDILALNAKLSAAKAKQAEATLMYRRYDALYKEKAVAKAVLDNANSSFEAAAAQTEAITQELEKARQGSRQEEIDAMNARLSGIRSQLNQARNALSDTVLSAPFSGYISQKLIENFETVRAGQPIVLFLDVSQIEVTVGIPEELVVQKSAFQDFSCEFDTYPGKRFAAVLKEIGKKPRPSNQTYPVTVTIQPGADTARLQPGMAATLRFSVPSEKEHRPIILPV
ncbi:MAG: efflux RND transporter periplasmic adaptor subunit, partial [Desulfobacterales bacterium]|nr:efflux RND transporter periplasmic adaptor subunit [Desulfobacterales bacterium]